MMRSPFLYSTLSLVVWCVALQGCSRPVTTARAEENQDFYVSLAPSGFKADIAALTLATTSPQECEKHIQTAVCETTATSGQITADFSSITCSANSASYLPAIMELYSEMPELMRPSLCTLERIFISDGISSTAFASSIVQTPGEMPIGGYAGFRKGSFVHQPDLSRLLSWKEQLVYGGSTAFLSNDPNLVQVSYGLKLQTLPKDGLFYVMIHELGHLIDFENNINPECVNNCHAPQPGWAKLSWRNQRTPLPDAAFYKQEDFCYYGCAEAVDPLSALQIYTSLQKSAFITTYAGMNALEDFAENWAWYVMRKFKNPDYRISIPGQGDLDMNAAFTDNAKIKAKLQFIDQLYNSPNLRVAHGVNAQP